MYFFQYLFDQINLPVNHDTDGHIYRGEKEPNGKRYRILFGPLREACAHKFEGISLLLKTMKKQGLVDFEGPVVIDDNAVITLL